MTVVALNDPGLVVARLDEIDRDLANRLNEMEAAALAWYRVKRDKEKACAEAFLRATGTVAERKALADRETALIGVAEEAEYEALRHVVRVLETRASIGQSILRAQSR